MEISRETLIFLAVLVPSVILHEVSHGVVALAFGDDTARRAGRLTLNPIRHIDPFGTIILPAILVLSGAGAFGYAKPVPVNVRKLRNPRQQSLLVSLAGPATNITIAVAAGLLAGSALRPEEVELIVQHPELAPGSQVFLLFLGISNVFLAAFNLIPIPPLDGSAIIERFLPTEWWPRYLRLRQYSMGLLLVLVLVVPGALLYVFEPALRLWAQLL